MRVRGAVAELADALDLGSSSFGSAGSILSAPLDSELSWGAPLPMGKVTAETAFSGGFTPFKICGERACIESSISPSRVIDQTLVCNTLVRKLCVFGPLM